MNPFTERYAAKTGALQPKNRGLLLEPIVEGKDGVFGSAVSFAAKEVVRPDGQWTPVEFERQSRDFYDSFSCVSFGLNNQEEVYKLNRYGLTVNHSDRALAKLSDTQPNGNTPQKVYEARRKKGFLFENEWPWPESVVSWVEYMAELPQKLITLAVGRGAEWRFWHDYVTPNPANIREALKYSPVAVSNSLMLDAGGVYYKPQGWPDTHWALIIGYYDNGDWKLLDTYFPFEKRVRGDTVFEQAKIVEIDNQVVDGWWFSVFLKRLLALLGL